MLGGNFASWRPLWRHFHHGFFNHKGVCNQPTRWPCMSYYDVLLVDQNATLEDIKVAFKRRALQVHPDKGGSKEAFHLVYQALETLSDPVARERYDDGLTRNGRKPRSPRPREASKKPRGPVGSKTGPSGFRVPRKNKAKRRRSDSTKWVHQIHFLLKQLPRDLRNEVIKKDFSQQQRLILEKWMVEDAKTSQETEAEVEKDPKVKMQEHSVRLQTDVADDCLTLSTCETTTPMKTASAKRRLQGSTIFGGIRNNPSTSDGSSYDCLTLSTCEKTTPMKTASAKRRSRGSTIFGGIRKNPSTSDGGSYRSAISIHAIFIEMYSAKCDLPTALEYLLILTSVKQKMLCHSPSSDTFEEFLHEALVSSISDHGKQYDRLKLCFCVQQRFGFFTGRGVRLRTPYVRNLADLKKIRCCFVPFQAYSKNKWVGGSIYWWYSLAHLEEEWKRFQLAVVDAWKVAGADSTIALRKVRSGYSANAVDRLRQLEHWERHHMNMQDNVKHVAHGLRNILRALQQSGSLGFHSRSENILVRQLARLKALLVRWRQALTKESQESQRQSLRQRMKDIKERRERREREALEKKRKEEEDWKRWRREKLRKKSKPSGFQDLFWLWLLACPEDKRWSDGFKSILPLKEIPFFFYSHRASHKGFLDTIATSTKRCDLQCFFACWCQTGSAQPPEDGVSLPHYPQKNNLSVYQS